MVRCAIGLVLLALAWQSAGAAGKRPNVVWMLCESTAGYAYFANATSPMPLPNIRKLQAQGVSFESHYVDAPVCCPSRASSWSGRHVHNIKHKQAGTGLPVGGAWNNFEGLDASYRRVDQVLGDNGYFLGIYGKLDYNAGGHSLSCRTSAWCNKVNFPYTLSNGSAGWYNEDGPSMSTGKGNRTHLGDWENAEKLADFIHQQTNSETPWFGFFGANIVHPPYSTSDYWLAKVDRSKITAPQWDPIAKMHPEDFRSSMLKKMASSDCCTDDFKLDIMQRYYAMIAEYDAMVGTVMDAVADSGQMDNTWIILTSDHGDMNMQKRQFYKMVPFENSVRVPLTISGPGVKSPGSVQYMPTSSLYYYPTILDLAGVTKPENLTLDGVSLLPLLTTDSDPSLPSSVLSQFHGDDIHLSWFLIRNESWKLIVFGSGAEVAPHLYNLADDPQETNDLATQLPDRVAALNALLKSRIDYPAVAANVESYNKDSFALWRASFPSDAEYRKTISTTLRGWKDTWSYNSTGCFDAIDAWLKTPNTTFDWAFPDGVGAHAPVPVLPFRP